VGRGCADDNTTSIFVGLSEADENTTSIFVGLNAADENRSPKSSRSRARTFSVPLAPFSVLSAAARRAAAALPSPRARTPGPPLAAARRTPLAVALPSPPHSLSRAPVRRARPACPRRASRARTPDPPLAAALSVVCARPSRVPRLPSPSVARARPSTPSSTVHAVRRARPPSVHAKLYRARPPSVHDALVPRGEPPRLPSSPSVLCSEFVFGARCFGIRPSGLCQVAGGGTWLRPATWR
jgi:hypothetical protein